MDIELRPARVGDAPFLAWAMLVASRSHLDYGVMEYYVGGDERNCLAYLTYAASTRHPHFLHYSSFIVAEVGGQKVGALCGFDPKEMGFRATKQARPEIFGNMEWAEDDIKAADERLGVYLACSSDDVDGAWVIEHVAVIPEFRGKGVIDRLLAEILDMGRNREFKVAQVSCFINNLPAQRAYERFGFRVDQEKRDSVFEEIFGTPGMLRLTLGLT